MIAYKIPKTPEGVFCALFESFTLKEKPIAVFSFLYQPTFDCKVKTLRICKENADRVKKGIIKCGGISLLSSILYLLRSDDELCETILFNAAYKCLLYRKNVLDNYGDSDILAFYELKNKISFEAHKTLGFIRFEKLNGGVWYSHISPDNNIVDLLAPHFKGRFPNEKFIIHDVKRNVITTYNGKDIITFQSPKPITVYLDSGEVEFQNLWRVYFHSVNVKERKNEKLQAEFLPRRYRKHMTEFLDDVSNEILTTPFSSSE